MTTFSVWAPRASERVDLVLPAERRRLEMVPDGRPGPGGGRCPPDNGGVSRRGWWAVDVPEAGPGTDYQFSIDGGPALPDPRSPFQPDGVHGPSRVLDHGAFEWTDHVTVPRGRVSRNRPAGGSEIKGEVPPFDLVFPSPRGMLVDGEKSRYRYTAQHWWPSLNQPSGAAIASMRS